MPIQARLFNGQLLEFPDDTPMEVVNRVAQEQTKLLKGPEEQPVAVPPPPPQTQRTVGQSLADLGAGAIAGTGSILAFPGQIASLVPGLRGVGSAIATPGEAIREFGEGLKSEGLKVREALRSQAISEAEKEGVLASFATAITSTLKDPALISTFLAEQVPMLLPPLAAARLYQILGRGAIAAAERGLVGEAAQAAAQQAAQQVNRRAYAAAVGTGAAMQGADISSDTYKRAYEAAIAQGQAPDEAETNALNAARLAFTGATGVSLLTQRLPGARAIEERFARLPGSTGRIKAGLGEATQEGLEEAGGALFQNLGVRTVDPNAQLLEGVGSAAGLGALGGGIFGTLLGKKGKQALAPGQMEGESIEQTINRLVSERAALTAPTAPALPTALEMIEMVNKQPGYGYSTIVKFIGSLEQLPDSPEKAQALQTANEIKNRLNVEDRERNTPTNRNVISGTDLQDLGFGTQDPVFQKLNGKDLAKPDQAVDVLKTLETELAREDLTGDRYQTLTGMMESVNAYLDQLPGSGFYAGEIEQPGVGERTPVAEPTGREPAETAGPVERGGVALAGEPLSDSALAKAESTAPLEFETKTGDVYSVDEQGRTSSQKAPGAREVLYVAPDAASALVDAMRVRETTSVRLGYRDGNIFKTVNQRSEIPEGKQPIIGVINALDQMIDAYPAQTNPAIGFTPVEQTLTPAGKASTKIGNPITNIRRVINKDVLNALGIKPASARGKRLLGKDIREIKKSLRPEELEAKFRELETRAKAPAKEAGEKPAKPVKPEEVAIKQRIAEIDKQLAKLLKVVLNKYGLNDVGVELAKDLEANGEYANRLIRLADNHENPLLHLRHESIHALKELGFFTPKQWQTLEQKAKDEWVNTYLKNVKHTETQSRYDAYIDLFKQQGKTQAEAEQALIEEAIADAFSYFQKAKPPAGFLASINNRLKNFFKAIKEFLGSNNLTAEDIFGKIEAGELKPAKDKNPAPAAEPPRASLRGVPSIDRERSLNAKRISPRFPTAVKATEDVLGPVRLQPDLETFKRDPVAFRYNIGLMSQYPNFTDIKGTPDQRAEQIINRMRDNLLWLYKHWDENLRNRSKLWYVGGNRIAHRWAEKYGIPPETAAAIIASLSPQKDWFQNVSLAERTLDALIFNADTRWDASMDRVFKERAWTKKFPVKQYRGKTLKEMYVPGDPKSLAKMAVWIRAWDEGHNPQTARVITPEGTFTNEVSSGKTGKPIAMRAQSFAAMVKTLQILQDSDLRNFSELIGKNHKVRSFYNNIIAPFAGEDVTIDTHAVAAALMRPLGSSDLEVHHNFGSAKPAKKDKEGKILVPASKGTKNSAVTGLYGTYAMYAEAYRRAAADARILPREMQSITWEAIRGLFRPEQKQAKLKTQVNALWNQVAKGKLSGQEALEQISKLVSGIEDPAWVKSPAGSNDSRTDSSYATELPGTRVPGREPGPVPSGTGERAAGAVPKLSLRSPLGFYSALMDGIQSSPTTSAPASGWQAQIKGMVNKGQVKQDEVEWSTINDYLDLRTGKVSKDDLLNYLENEGVKVEEVMLGRQMEDEKIWYVFSDSGLRIAGYPTEEQANARAAQESEKYDAEYRVVPEYQEVVYGDESKYEKYTLPGGTNYQEVLLTLPTPVSKELKQLEPEIRALGITEELGDVSLATLVNADASADLRQRFNDALSKARSQRSTEYISSHWNEPNVLAHIRLKDRTDVNGNKVLFVEEIQSDWGQEGKKKGFVSKQGQLPNGWSVHEYKQRAYPGGPVIDTTYYVIDNTNTQVGVYYPTPDEAIAAATSGRGFSSGIPVAPFVTKTEGWLNLALKRVIVMASEGGYDKVAFVNGAQSADRYDLSKQVDYIDYVKEGSDKYRIAVVGTNGQGIDLPKETFSSAELENYVGQEIAQKIVNGEGDFGGGRTTLRGADLKVGGEGMKAFYDTIIPTAVKKLLPKVGGGKMGVVEMDLGKPSRDPQQARPFLDWMEINHPEVKRVDAARAWSSGIENNSFVQEWYDTVRKLEQPGFDVTPEMRAKVEKGLPLFSLRSQTQIPAFKEWFGDSKIVDENGEPLVMYHGTTKDFSVFQTKGGAVFVTPNRSFANKIAMDDMLFTNSDVPIAPSGANVMPVYVRAERPFDFENPSDIKTVQKLLDDPVDKKRFATNAQSGKWQVIEDFLGVIEDAGFDGAYISEQGIKNLAVFSPTQIKSAIGNVGTFSATDPDIRKSLRSPQQSLRNTIPASTWNRVNMTIGQRNQKTWVQRITDAISPKNWSDFRTNALNRYEGLARIDRMKVAKMGGARLMADQSAEAAALFSDLGAGISAAAFGVHDRIGGYPVFRNGVVTIDNKNGTVKGPLAIFAPLAAYNDPDVYRLYQFWVTAQRGQRLNAEGRLTPFDAADMAEVQRINNDPQLGPMFRQIKDEWIKYNDGLVKFMEDTGVITPEASKEFRIHGDYFPMYKYMEQEDTAGPRVFSSIANVPVPKKLKGDEVNPMGDFFENVVRNTQSAIQMGIKNIAAQRATQVAVDVGSAVKLPGRPTRMEPNYYRVLENGKEVFYASSDVMFLNAIKSLQLPDLPFIGFLAAPANILRNLVTKTPDFMGANMLRDSVAAWVSSGTDITPIISTLKNFGTAIAEKSPELNALRNAGILGGYDYAQGVDVTARKFAKDLRKIAGARTAAEKAASPFTSIWEALEKGSSASDAATRMEVYKKTLDETGNEAEALFRALEVMNFNRKGRSPVIRILTASIPFLNARMQGLDVLYRAGIRPILTGDASTREKEIAKTFWVRGMTIMALSAMYWALTHDDDEYKKQEQETRDNYWLFPSMGIKIPIPFEIGVVFKVIPERIAEYAFGSDTGKDFVESMSRQLRSTFGVNYAPQAVLPLWEAQTNFSYFTQRPIIGQGMEEVSAPYQVAPTTSRTSQGLANAYNEIISFLPENVQKKIQASPIILDHLIQGYTGTMGTYAVQAIDAVINANSDIPSASKRFEQMPVIKRFALDPQARGTVSAYYDLKNSVTEVVRTSNLLERTGQFDEYAQYLQKNIGMLASQDYVNDLEKTMKDLREMKLVIRTSTMSGDAKREQLDNVERLEAMLTSNIQKVKKSL